ncbi:MAG TPA: DUF1810 domain-containing protein [Acidobacteriaceae bacterium]|nr:DUF1810 domain-containing protein [Acidobacteriaceae bacterium]
MNDPYNLQRFVDAQKAMFEQARAELSRGKKASHWMWFIFPQIRGLGASETAQFFAISSLAEAAAYLEHPVLGPRLRECARLVTAIEGKSIEHVFGYPDNLKFKSSMTLFARATPENGIFLEALKIYFGGEFDRQTLDRL